MRFLSYLLAACLVASTAHADMRERGSHRGTPPLASESEHYIPTPAQLADPRWAPGNWFNDNGIYARTGPGTAHGGFSAGSHGTGYGNGLSGTLH